MIKKEYPDEGELIVGTVIKVQNFGAFIRLDEYPDKEGFIHIAEIATGWVKRIRNHIKEKQKVVCKVLHVDSAKNHISKLEEISNNIADHKISEQNLMREICQICINLRREGVLCSLHSDLDKSKEHSCGFCDMQFKTTVTK